MKEYGGYFGLEILVEKEYYKDLIALNSGRNALLYLLEAKQIEKLFIPHYLCDSVSELLSAYGYDYEYYNIDSNFLPVFNNALMDNEFIFIVNYYGQLNDSKVSILKKKYRNIIVDNTHAFFQRPVKGIDTLYTCRKFFGVPDGAYLSTDTVLEKELETDISMSRMTHVLGRFEGLASDYFKIYQESEVAFKNEPLKKMSKLTKNLLGAIDYEQVKNKRDANYTYLFQSFEKVNLLELMTPIGAFSYPLYLENAKDVREKLLNKKIYIPTLWPNVLDTMPEDSIEYKYVANILPLPCDQRYNVSDMKYISEEIMKCIS